MRATTRFWTLAVLAGFLVFWAGIVESVVLLGGAALLTAWLLAQQYRFVTATSDGANLTIEQTLSRGQVTANDATLLTLAVDSPEPLAFDCDVHPVLPAGAEAVQNSFTLERNERTGSHTVEVTWPVAGSFTVDSPQLTFRDRFGLFERTLTEGPTRTVRVEPRAPRNIHVGHGGEAVVAGFGEHEAGRTGSGLEPAEVREYIPGDTVRNIDWKATARLGEPHVREFEAETDRETALFVDHRASLGTGTAGETKLDFHRQVALAFVDSARELSDPLGSYTVGDEGLTGSFDPDASADHQLAVRRQIQTVEPTTPAADGKSDARSPATPARVREVNRRLADDDSAYGRRLGPYFDRPNAYVERIADRPLVAATRSALARLDGTVWSVVLTDDTQRTEVREAVKLARRGQGRVLVFLTPTVLYEPGGLGDLETAYERYADFEEFRASLAAMERVSAFEVGPADRLSAVLASGRQGTAGARNQ